MNSQAIIGIVILISVLGAGFLIYQSFATAGPPYVFVEDLKKMASELVGPNASTRVSVHGKVADNSIRPMKDGVTFKIKGEKGGVQAVSFPGVPPQGLEGGRSVSLQGRLYKDGSLVADEIDTKCPSKYEDGE